MSYFCSFLCTVFDAILSNINEILSINLSANVVLFGDLSVYNKDSLSYSDGNDRPVVLCYNFSVSNDFTQMVNVPTWFLDCDSRNPALLDLFIYFDSSICSTVAFLPFPYSVSIVFLQTQIDQSLFIAQTLTILVLIRTLFVIIWETLYKRMCLNLAVLLLVLNSVSVSWEKLMYIPLIVNIRSSLINSNDFQLLVLLA